MGCYTAGDLVILDYDEERQPAELGGAPEGEERGVGVCDEGFTDIHGEDFTLRVLWEGDG